MMMSGGTEGQAEEGGSQLTVSISMNGFHEEGIPRIQAFLGAGSGVLRACRIQGCNKIKHLNKYSSAPLFLISGPVILSRTLKIVLGKCNKLLSGLSD